MGKIIVAVLFLSMACFGQAVRFDANLLTPTATNIATTYISAKTTSQITVTHVSTSGLTYDVICTAY